MSFSSLDSSLANCVLEEEDESSISESDSDSERLRSKSEKRRSSRDLAAEEGGAGLGDGERSWRRDMRDWSSRLSKLGVAVEELKPPLPFMSIGLKVRRGVLETGLGF